MFNILSGLNIQFSEQTATRSGFIIDFTIYIDRKTDNKLAIEVDGANWHSSGSQRKRDNFRDHILRSEGWMVIRFSENFTKREVINRLKTYIILSDNISD